MYDYHRLIANANDALARSQTEWAKNYWSGVVKELVKKMREQETVH